MDSDNIFYVVVKLRSDGTAIPIYSNEDREYAERKRFVYESINMGSESKYETRKAQYVTDTAPTVREIKREEKDEAYYLSLVDDHSGNYDSDVFDPIEEEYLDNRSIQ